MSLFDQPHSDLLFRFAQPQDVHAVQNVLTGIVQRMPVTSWFAPLTDQELNSLISGAEGFSIIVLSNTTSVATKETVKYSDILALMMIRTCGIEKSLTDVMESVRIPLEHTAVMDVIAVHEQHRGKGLQTILSQMAEEELKVRGFLGLVATVHPENIYSLNNFLKAGYQIVWEGNLYNNQRRFLVWKQLLENQHMF